MKNVDANTDIEQLERGDSRSEYVAPRVEGIVALQQVVMGSVGPNTDSGQQTSPGTFPV